MNTRDRFRRAYVDLMVDYAEMNRQWHDRNMGIEETYDAIIDNLSEENKRLTEELERAKAAEKAWQETAQEFHRQVKLCEEKSSNEAEKTCLNCRHGFELYRPAGENSHGCRFHRIYCHKHNMKYLSVKACEEGWEAQE